MLTRGRTHAGNFRGDLSRRPAEWGWPSARSRSSTRRSRALRVCSAAGPRALPRRRRHRPGRPRQFDPELLEALRLRATACTSGVAIHEACHLRSNELRLDVDLAGLLELLRLLRILPSAPRCQVVRRVVAHLLRQLHRAELRPAHRAEVRDLRAVGGQRLVVIGARGHRIHRQVELILPAELEARLRQRVVPGLRARMALRRDRRRARRSCRRSRPPSRRRDSAGRGAPSA